MSNTPEHPIEADGKEREALVGWSTYPTAEAAEAAAQILLGEHLAACIQIDGPIRSFYRWEGKTHADNEWRMTVKLVREKLPALSRRLKETHPYSTPQWIVVHADYADPEYLRWLNDC